MAGRHAAVTVGRGTLAGAVPIAAMAVVCAGTASASDATAVHASITVHDAEMMGGYTFSMPERIDARMVAAQSIASVPEVASFDSLPFESAIGTEGQRLAAAPTAAGPDQSDHSDLALGDISAPAPIADTGIDQLGQAAINGAGIGAAAAGVPAAVVGGLAGGALGAGIGVVAGLVVGSGGTALAASIANLALCATGIGCTIVLPALAAEAVAAIPIAAGAMAIGGLIGAGIGAVVGAAALGLPAAAIGAAAGAAIGAGAQAAGLT